MPYILVKVTLAGTERFYRCETIADVEALQQVFASIGLSATVVN